MSRSREYWVNAWDNANTDLFSNENAARALSLLSGYAGFSKTFAAVGLSVSANAGRFFSINRHAQHRLRVEQAINNFYHVDGMCAHSDELHSVEYILALVKQKIGNNGIALGRDDLAGIFAVIYEQTGVGYHSLDAEAVIERYEPTPSVTPTTSSQLPTAPVSLPKPPQYSPHTQAYIDSFANKQSFQSQLDELSLTEEEQEEVKSKFECVISQDIMNVPVLLNDNFYNLSSLKDVTKDPATRELFIPRDIQSGRSKMHEMNAFIEKVTARIESESRLAIK